jgi:hypothetical protein
MVFRNDDACDITAGRDIACVVKTAEDNTLRPGTDEAAESVEVPGTA